MDEKRRTPAAPSGNLPVVLSSFVGRRGETAELATALEEHRLVTVTGPAGIGKTRLALEIAHRVQPKFPGGAWFVDLSIARRARDVARAVAAQVSARDLPQQSIASSLVTQLGTRRLFLVLDNCEHVLDACAELASALLGARPRLLLLATSREALGVPGEIVRLLAGLPVPGERHDCDQPAGKDAVRLFLDRAAEAGAPLAGTIDPAVIQICRRLDGVPLAIELAAAWVGCLTPAEIAERLDQSLYLLTRGVRTGPARHRTLRAAVEWSFDLLSPEEQTMLGRLAVFAGGWTVSAAEAVCSGSPLGGGQILDLLAGLAGKSMVVRDSLPDGFSRFRLLETIREYAHEKLLESGEEAELRDRHLAWCLELAEQAERDLSGAQQTVWLRRLDAESANLGSALQWGLRVKRSESALRLATGLTLFWLIRGRGPGEDR